MLNTIKVQVVRVYITESSGLLHKVVTYLKKDIKIRGLSVFRAISGFGDTGEHTAALIDLSIDLPITIEFFDIQEKIAPALIYLNTIIKAEHIIVWDASANDK